MTLRLSRFQSADSANVLIFRTRVRGRSVRNLRYYTWSISHVPILRLVSQQQKGRTICFILRDPQPTVFVGAMILFTLVELWLHSFHQHNKYHNRCLVIGVMLGVIAAIIRQSRHINETLDRSLRLFLPPAIVMSSLISVIGHHAFTVASKADAAEAQKDIPEDKDTIQESIL